MGGQHNARKGAAANLGDAILDHGVKGLGVFVDARLNRRAIYQLVGRVQPGPFRPAVVVVVLEALNHVLRLADVIAVVCETQHVNIARALHLRSDKISVLLPLQSRSLTQQNVYFFDNSDTMVGTWLVGASAARKRTL